MLFGSRVDDAQRGGDIDLYVESPLVLSEALQKAHESIKLIAGSAEAIILDMKQRAWVE